MSSRKEQKASVRAERVAQEEATAAQTKRKQRFWQLGGVTVVAAVVVVVLIVLSQSGSEKAAPKGDVSIEGSSQINSLFSGVAQKNTVVGEAEAPVTVIEYGDPQCPVCAEFSKVALPTIVKRYVRTGKVRMEFRPLTFLDDKFGVDDSNRAANFTLAAGKQNKLWQTIDLIYANQSEEGTGYITDDFLLSVGQKVKGLDAQKALDESKNDAFAEQLATVTSESQADGVQGTPAFVIGKTGEAGKLWNYSSFNPAEFSKKLDEELNHAQ